jgi:hypothetical protein
MRTSDFLIDGLTANLLLALAGIVILNSEPHGIHYYILLSDGSGNFQAFNYAVINSGA